MLNINNFNFSGNACFNPLMQNHINNNMNIINQKNINNMYEKDMTFNSLIQNNQNNILNIHNKNYFENNNFNNNNIKMNQMNNQNPQGFNNNSNNNQFQFNNNSNNNQFQFSNNSNNNQFQFNNISNNNQFQFNNISNNNQFQFNNNSNNNQSIQGMVSGGNKKPIPNFFFQSSDDNNQNKSDPNSIRVVFVMMQGNKHVRTYKKTDTLKDVLEGFVSSLGLSKNTLKEIYFLFNATNLNNLRQSKTLKELKIIDQSRINVVDLNNIIGAFFT